MTLYKTTITPISNFSTPLQGDTIFGQLCWMVRFVYGKERLDSLLNTYESSPFLIVSDAMPQSFVKKPTMPSFLLGEDSKDKKENRKKRWLKFDELIKGDFSNTKKDDEIELKDKEETIIKNSINYKTSTTDSEGFAPFGESESCLSKKDIFFLVDEHKISSSELETIFTALSQNGYGKNTTIGKGRFVFDEFEKIDLDSKAKSYMTLSSASLQDIEAKELFYEPITKFGKHGFSKANKNPFKKPLLLADAGAVVVFDTAKDIQYIGNSIKGHSNHKETVHQGYSIVLPIRGI